MSDDGFRESYRLGVDDKIELTVYGEKDLSGMYRVAADGTIAVPLIGSVTVQGKSLMQAESQVRALLMDGYLIDPSVSIQMDEYRPFYILGEVRAPGKYSYAANMNVLNAVATAGGFTYRADQDDIKVRRGAGSEYGDIGTEDSVMPGDILLIEERFF